MTTAAAAPLLTRPAVARRHAAFLLLAAFVRAMIASQHLDSGREVRLPTPGYDIVADRFAPLPGGREGLSSLRYEFKEPLESGSRYFFLYDGQNKLRMCSLPDIPESAARDNVAPAASQSTE
ncbi:MAG: hypothetical protein NTW86_13225 [Candidatus Sumerlaeota bacterium]|nr:hypothetical protein [Candidatus Sumerlaeota bacterium]